MGQGKVEKVAVTKIVVYSDRKASEDEVKDEITYDPQGDLTCPEAVDTAIEDPESRSKLPANAGNISLTVVAGDELGDITVNIQFEGKRGLHDQCLRNSGSLLDAASTWLGEILGELDGEFDLEIEAKPCPHAAERLPLKRAAENLVGHGRNLEVEGRSQKVVVKHEVKR